MIAIVGVHGVGHLDKKNERAEIVSGMSRRWTEAIAKGLGHPASVFNVRCAYYSPFLASSYTPQGDALDTLPDEAKDMFVEWLEDLGAPPVVVQGQMGWPLRQGAHWVQKLFPRFTKAAIATFFHEVHTYLRAPSGPHRSAAREEVAQTIREGPTRVVIAHSLGSVITYEALWADPDLTADLLITIGSPLGMRPVLSRLEPSVAQSLGHRPPGVRRWLNIADPGDPIAVPYRLRKLFPGIELDRTDSIGPLSIHSATAYLKGPLVAASIAPFLTAG
jgi:hypothetical protein